MTADPYPQSLADIDVDYSPASTLEPLAQDAYVVALNRIATALEQLVLATLDKPSQSAQNAPQRHANLAALPPVQVVADKPACPFHGLEKVRTSDKGPGFFCSAKAQPGQPSNAKGYCTWHS